jgi:hypothetical protein
MSCPKSASSSLNPARPYPGLFRVTVRVRTEHTRGVMSVAEETRSSVTSLPGEERDHLAISLFLYAGLGSYLVSLALLRRRG